MEDEYIVFERLFEKTDEIDGLFVKFVSNKDTKLEYMAVQGITFSESLGNMIPIMIVDFVDGSGDFINHNRLDTDATYTLFFGRTPEYASETVYTIADIETTNKTGGRSNNAQFKVIFVQENWKKVTSEKFTRAWVDKKFSDVVSEVVSDINYSETDIEESRDIITNIVQSNEANNTFIQSLSHKAMPPTEDGHYVYCGTLDNRFFFLSTSELIQRGVEEARNESMPILSLGGNPGPAVRKKAIENNERVPIGFAGFSVDERYMENVSTGITSVDYSYYDWDEREYVREKKAYSDLNSTQLSELSLIRESTTDMTSKKVYGSRDKNTKAIALNELSMQSLDMQDVHINIMGQLEMTCGDIVEVMIPTGYDSQIPYSEMYSGFYMIKQIEHRMSLARATDFVSHITITRHGMDSQELEGYTVSKNGKARFS